MDRNPDESRMHNSYFVMAMTNAVLLMNATAHAQEAGPAPPSSLPSYSQQIAPILARHCLECHGPDERQREADLRLDKREAAISVLPSGTRAIFPGKSVDSELIRRVTANGELRMPPADAEDRLNSAEIELLKRWIDGGAEFEQHWAFRRPQQPPIPVHQNDLWSRNSIDRFILRKLRTNGLSPYDEPGRSTLIRRVYLDTLGIPPSAVEIDTFVRDRRHDAYERLVDRVLASPLYGQRWGRHWLDVARYADSNGSDENHSYPNAWRYRDYVIRAMNQDLPFDQFIHEQLAGDLLGDSDANRSTDRVIATGFLALGTKILAEQDESKKRADIVDEQIDTIGKSFLGLTLACARCHDHKFDPIPTADYYAMAGILHSTQLIDAELLTHEWQLRRKAHDAALESVRTKKAKLLKTLEADGGVLIGREAESYDRGNAAKLDTGYGQGIGIIADSAPQLNFAEYDLQIDRPGRFLLQVRYAAMNARPGRILLNGTPIREKAITEASGGWMPEHQQWFSEGIHELKSGLNTVRIESSPLMSHIDRLRLIRSTANQPAARLIEEVTEVESEEKEILKSAPTPPKAMAAAEGTVRDSRLHKRGSHLSLGAAIPRGFPSAFAEPGVPDTLRRVKGRDGSGRLELARWMTDDSNGAAGQTARVIVNRLWHWHFGQGLSATPNNFGIRGDRPSHPELLDWLAVRLIDSDWSMKSIHRLVLTSSTYRQRVTTTPRGFFHGFPRRRLDAETIRDTMLFHAGKLDVSAYGDPVDVTSQNPSPVDMKTNEERYRNSRRRSVYLPVVRSNVFRMFTLFDFPNAATSVGRRDSTTVPTQALLMMNDPFVIQCAADVARKTLDRLRDRDLTTQVQFVHRHLLGRDPTSAEHTMAIDFFDDFSEGASADEQSERNAWTAYCQTLMLSNDYIFME